jgi:hypothetical protein
MSKQLAYIYIYMLNLELGGIVIGLRSYRSYNFDLGPTN